VELELRIIGRLDERASAFGAASHLPTVPEVSGSDISSWSLRENCHSS